MGLLSLGRVIEARLEAVLPDTTHVVLAHSVDDFKLAGQLAPAVAIAYGGGEPVESRPDGKAVRIRQHWLVVVFDRNLADLDAGADALADAGGLVDRALDALLGWHPDGVSKPFSLTGMPAPRYLVGYQEVSLRFSTEFVRKAPA